MLKKVTKRHTFREKIMLLFDKFETENTAIDINDISLFYQMEESLKLMETIVKDQISWIKKIMIIHEINNRKIQELENYINYLQSIIDDKNDQIAELESLQDPYSNNGDPVCNSPSKNE